MTSSQWRPYHEPPDSDRVIVMRFDERGDYDCEGQYHKRYGAYARRYASVSQGRFVHPKYWRERDAEDAE